MAFLHSHFSFLCRMDAHIWLAKGLDLIMFIYEPHLFTSCRSATDHCKSFSTCSKTSLTFFIRNITLRAKFKVFRRQNDKVCIFWKLYYLYFLSTKVKAFMRYCSKKLIIFTTNVFRDKYFLLIILLLTECTAECTKITKHDNTQNKKTFFFNEYFILALHCDYSDLIITRV